MTPRETPRPTDAELAILRVIWTLGSGTVREIHEELLAEQPKIGYTTVLKLLQESAQSTQRRLVGDLLDRAFAGSATALVMQALSTRKASSEELAAIREMLDTIEGERS